MRIRTGMVAVLAALLALPACAARESAGSPAGARSTVQAAVRALGEGRELTATVTLDTDAAALAAVGGSRLPATGASKLVDTTLVLSSRAAAGHTLAEHAAGAGSALTVSQGGPPLLEVRRLSADLYARVDAGQLLAASGADPTALAGAVGQLGSQAPLLMAAAAGQWLHLDTAVVKGSLPFALPTAEPGRLAAALDAELAVVPGPGVEGFDGAHYVLSGNARDLAAAIQGLVPTDPSGATQGRDLPDRTVTADVFVDRGRLTGLRVDLTQFLSEEQAAMVQGHRLAVRALFASSAALVTAPETSTDVPPAAVTGLQGLLSSVLPGVPA